MRLAWIDNLRGIGILFIVLGHVVGAGCHLSTGASQEFCDAAYKYFYAFHVPLFFVVAGMTFKRQEWGRFFKSRFLRLLVPYFVFGVAAAVIYSLMQSGASGLLNGTATTSYYQGKAVNVSFCDQLVNLALGGWHELGFVGNSVLWFIPALFSVELVAQSIARLEGFSGKKRCVWGVAAVAALSAYMWVRLPQLPWALGMAPKYLPYFILGIAVGKRTLNVDRKWLFAGAFPAVLVFGCLAVVNPYQWYEKCAWQHLVSIGIAVGNIFAWQGIAQSVSGKWLEWCGVWSLGIMLMHKYPMLLVQNYFSPVRGLFGGGVPGMLLGVAIVFFCSVGACVAACVVLRRFAPRVLGVRDARDR